jgi:class 3 adenylate cyclase
LDAALDLHRTLQQSGLMVADQEPYRVCIGIGYGRVLDDGSGGKMGDEMNVVAKLAEDVAEAGQTLLSESAYRSLSARAAVPVEKIELCLSTVSVTCYRVRD